MHIAVSLCVALLDSAMGSVINKTDTVKCALPDTKIVKVMYGVKTQSRLLTWLFSRL